MRVLAVLLVALGLAGLASAAGPAPGDRPVVIPGCDPLYYEHTGFPSRLIVSNLPLADSAHTAMHQMTQAIKLEVKDGGFRAGRFNVGYISCDDSGAAGASSRSRCVANARKAAQHLQVIVVIGTLDSSCARQKLPVLAAAHVLLLSPLNTADDLTRTLPPRMARLSATDSEQAAAAARFLRGTGARTVAALSDGTPRGGLFRASFVRAATRIGLRVVRRGADSAYVGGVLAGPTRKTLATARRLAPGGPLALAAGYGPVAQLADTAGQAIADGAYLFVAGVPDERLGAPGQAFVRHFEASIGTAPHPYAVYAAQAAQLVLAALAHAGTRRGVADAILRARVRSGLIGSFAFSRRGDIEPAPVTIFRVHGRSADIVRVVDSGIP
jgi:branched-chain amino acid transport system substrate-binding protein